MSTLLIWPFLWGLKGLCCSLSSVFMINKKEECIFCLVFA